MLVPQVACMTVIDVVLFGDLVQTVDAGVSSGQPFFQLGARTEVLIAWNVKFHPQLADEILHIPTATPLSTGRLPPPPRCSLSPSSFCVAGVSF